MEPVDVTRVRGRFGHRRRARAAPRDRPRRGRAELALLTKPTVVHAVDELERLGYVRRVPDERDRRAKLVVPTARALEAERVGRETIAQVRASWAKLLGAGEMDALEAGLARLRAVLWPELEAPR